MNNVNASIITIGDELLIGQTIDTNSAFIARALNEIGVWVHRRVAIGDQAAAITKALDTEKEMASIIILTGGLGPTADDKTKDALCQYFGGKMVINKDALQQIKKLFEKVYPNQQQIIERNLQQAEVPDVCTVLPNKRGSAPGMLFSTGEKNKDLKIFISLPGVPYEMEGLITDEVIPYIQKNFDLPAIVHKTALTAGKGESIIAEMLSSFEKDLPKEIQLAYLPNYGLVKLRLTAFGHDKQTLENKIEPYFQKMLSLVHDNLVTDKDEELAAVVGRLLMEKNKTIGTAESCTGGYIAHQLTTIPGSSAYYAGSVVSYSYEAKEKILGVHHETLLNFGAVSEETVTEMARGALKTLETDYVIAVSGIMGPGGSTPDKPVGTVWMAVADANTIQTRQLNLRFNRQKNIEITAARALNMLRLFICERLV